MTEPLTQRQRELLTFVEAEIAVHGYAPTYQEIAHRFTYASLSTVWEHLHALQAKGYLVIHRGEARGIELTMRRIVCSQCQHSFTQGTT